MHGRAFCAFNTFSYNQIENKLSTSPVVIDDEVILNYLDVTVNAKVFGMRDCKIELNSKALVMNSFQDQN